MARYTPWFVTQFDGSRLAGKNCTMAAGAMLLDKQTGGRVRASGGELRARQSDQDGGTDLRALAAAFRTYGQDLSRVTLPTVLALRNALASGAGAVLQGYYGSLPAAYRLQANANIGHALYVDHVTQTTGPHGGWWYWVMDPIGRGGYQGAYVPEAAVRSFGWTAGGGGFLGSAALSSRATAGGDQPQGRDGTLAGLVGKTANDVMTEIDYGKILEIYRTEAGIANPEGLFGKQLRPYIGKRFGAIPFNAGGIVNWDPLRDIPAAVTNTLGDLTAAIGDAAVKAVYLAAILALVLLGTYMLVKS